MHKKDIMHGTMSNLYFNRNNTIMRLCQTDGSRIRTCGAFKKALRFSEPVPWTSRPSRLKLLCPSYTDKFTPPPGFGPGYPLGIPVFRTGAVPIEPERHIRCVKVTILPCLAADLRFRGECDSSPPTQPNSGAG